VSLQPEHPAANPDAVGKVCADERCATFLDPHAEICDECGGTRMLSLDSVPAILCGWAGERPVVFGLRSDRPAMVGRSAAGRPTPDVDLRRLSTSGVVHRRHARIELGNDGWQVTHLGTNLLVVTGRDQVAVEPGATASLRSGDRLQVGDVMLQVVVRRSPGRI
jgi:FHA domain